MIVVSRCYLELQIPHCLITRKWRIVTGATKTANMVMLDLSLWVPPAGKETSPDFQSMEAISSCVVWSENKIWFIALILDGWPQDRL